MLQNVVNIVKSASAFLQNGVAPPNCAPEYKKSLEEENHLASKKFFVIFSSIVMLAFVFYTSVGILWFIPRVPEIVAAFVTIFTKIMEVFGLVISVYIGAQGLVDLRYNSSSNAGLQGMVEVESQNITENLTHNTKEDDYTLEEPNESPI
jgi:hypothetical protein